MKAQQLYEELKQLAERLGIQVVEHNFRSTGTMARSGLCKIRGRRFFIMDKHRSLREKIDLLSDCLAPLDHEGHYVLPAVRDLLTPRQGRPATGDRRSGPS